MSSKPRKRAARVSASPRPEPIKDRATVTDAICDVMHDGEWRTGGIDALLVRPYDAIEMAEAVCRKLGIPETRENVHRVCRTALASRKRGELRRDRY